MTAALTVAVRVETAAAKKAKMRVVEMKARGGVAVRTKAATRTMVIATGRVAVGLAVEAMEAMEAKEAVARTRVEAARMRVAEPREKVVVAARTRVAVAREKIVMTLKERVVAVARERVAAARTRVAATARARTAAMAKARTEAVMTLAAAARVRSPAAAEGVEGTIAGAERVRVAK